MISEIVTGTEFMDFSKLMNELDNASLFELYRLRSAISKELDNPARIEKIKYMIRPGDTVSYYADEENRLIEAEVLEIKRTRALVQNKYDMKKWNIPFYMINTENISVDIHRNQKISGIDRHEIRIGDIVGFQDRENNTLRGKVIRINPKTVTLFVEPNQKWRVSYSMLHSIIDGQSRNQQRFIEGIIVEKDNN